MGNTTLRKLPVGIQDFEKLRNDGYLYVDKTEQIYRLVTTGCHYFLSRPRRFGKSLLISTIKAFFLGKKELFDGLSIASKADVDWAVHPVLHLDLNTEQFDTESKLIDKLSLFLSQAEAVYGTDTNEKTLGTRFEGVIRRACEKTGQRVVILVDEYDKPMLQVIGSPELQNAYRATLKGFYGALKSMDAHIKFAMLTGVTKFGKISVFSDLNHLTDISMDARYYDICGMREQDLSECFEQEMNDLAAANGMTFDECLLAMRQRYDGYHFEESAPGMYNPYSVLLTLAKQKFGSYWFETGTPTYLVELLQMHDYNLEEMSHVEADEDTLNSIDGGSTNPIPVIYQSGYLTIKDFDKEFGTYTLGFPNKEVEEGFTKFLMPCYIYPKDRQFPFLVNNFVRDVEQGNTDQFIKRLRSLFADTPYEIIKDLENHYQNVLWLLYKLMGFYTRAEYHTSQGRIDLVVKTPKYCYVMEFKLDGTAEEALAQIQDKDYALPFALEDQQIVRIGINFDSRTRNIDRCLVG